MLRITGTHVGSFSVGQNGATYTVTVSDSAFAPATSGMVAVSDTIPTGLTLVSMARTNWNCSANTCTSTNVLNPGASYPPITVTVNVAANAAPTVINQVSVSGGGASGSAVASDPTIVSPFSLCDFQQTGSVGVIDVQSTVNQALGKMPAANDLNGDGVVNLIDVQIEIDAVVTLSCAAKQ